MPPKKYTVKPFLVLVCLMLGVAEIAAALAPSVLPHFDFRSFYGAGVLIRSSPRELYALAAQAAVQSATVSNDHVLPYFGPPYEAVLFAPLSVLSYRHA